MEVKFKVVSGETVPEKAVSAVAIAHKASDWYFGIGINLSGEETKVLCCYFFYTQKWHFRQSGIISLKEYYV